MSKCLLVFIYKYQKLHFIFELNGDIVKIKYFEITVMFLQIGSAFRVMYGTKPHQY